MNGEKSLNILFVFKAYFNYIFNLCQQKNHEQSIVVLIFDINYVHDIIVIYKNAYTFIFNILSFF